MSRQHKQDEKKEEEKGMEKGLKEGLEKGIAETKLSIAKSMLEQGIDMEIVTKSTGLSAEEIGK